jgi:hypothetical protein
MRRELFDSLLKKRIFLADRLEKVEKVLINLNLIPKDLIYCSNESLEAFNLNLENEEFIVNVYDKIMNDKEEIWFDIYRSLTNTQENNE